MSHLYTDIKFYLLIHTNALKGHYKTTLSFYLFKQNGGGCEERIKIEIPEKKNSKFLLCYVYMSEVVWICIVI